MSSRRAIAHVGETLREIDPEEIDSLLRDRSALLWLDVEAPTDEDLALLREEFAFHELALEDALRGEQRPKADQYEGYYFLVLYTAASAPSGEIETHEVHCFWGRNYLVTLHHAPVAEIRAAVERWATSSEPRRQGVAYHAYMLLDAVVDGYFPVVDRLAERIEDLEDRVFDADPSIIRELFRLRRQLLEIRRLLAPTREMLNTLLRRDVPVFPPALLPYFTDVYDHVVRIIDVVDLHRELLASAVESHLSATSNRLNQTVRRLTAFTVALMVPTLIAGVYGMNFQHIPELAQPWGYPFALGLMAGAVVLLLAVYQRRGWL